jgi:hypothetical protein
VGLENEPAEVEVGQLRRRVDANSITEGKRQEAVLDLPRRDEIVVDRRARAKGLSPRSGELT